MQYFQEHRNTEHRNIPEHHGTFRNTQKTRNTPPQKKPGTPPSKKLEHFPKYQEERKISKTRLHKYVNVKKIKYITRAWAFLNYIHCLHIK